LAAKSRACVAHSNQSTGEVLMCRTTFPIQIGFD